MMEGIPERSRAQSGFTLLELLATVLVIVILAGLLFPLLRALGERAASAKCVAHLKVLGTASQAYAAGNSGYLPVTYSIDAVKGGSFTDGGGAWYWLIAPYVDVPRWETNKANLGPQGGKIDKSNVFTCPSHGKDEPQPLVFPSLKPVSYAPPGNISTSMQTRTPTSITETVNVWGLRLIDIRQPGRKVWLADSPFPNINSIGGNRLTAQDNTGWGRIAFSRHEGAGNALFYDGHVERITYISLVTGNKDQNVKDLFDPSTDVK